MRHHATIRFAATACALSTMLLCAQTHRQRRKPSPAITATPAPPPIQQPVAPAPPPTPAELPAQPAQVTFTNSLLTVAAHNSSLNQILRDISRETHMKITGGVADERVFGSYGPNSPAQVLNSLLDGTSSNMMLVGSNGTAPAELVLTPRAGGVTPPNPMSIATNQNQQHEEQHSAAPYKDPAAVAVPAPPSPPETAPAPPAQQAPGSELPTGARTPQDIFNQLMKMRQQQTQQHTQQPANPQQ